MISVIIPVLNEAERLGSLLMCLADQPGPKEIIVVDGGSDDASTGIAAGFGARVLVSHRGRGQQLAAGAAISRGDILLFLHADTRLPPGALSSIQRMLAAHPSAPGGNFRLLFDGDGSFDRWLERFYSWIRSHGFYYGDSGIFMRQRSYRRIGGFRPIPVMEDYDLVRRMETMGHTLCVEHPPLVTSSRRFHGRHPFAIFLGWVRIHLLFHLGVAPDRLARIYDNERRRERRATVRIDS
jgi:rSAM/selenodomain-associated transferase 2